MYHTLRTLFAIELFGPTPSFEVLEAYLCEFLWTDWSLKEFRRLCRNLIPRIKTRTTFETGSALIKEPGDGEIPGRSYVVPFQAQGIYTDRHDGVQWAGKSGGR
jgi:hypothetical protein